MTLHRLERIASDASALFIELDREGRQLYIRMGAIGTPGVQSARQLASAAAAGQAMAELRQDKLDQGYVEVAVPAVARQRWRCADPAPAGEIQWPGRPFEWSEQELERLPPLRCLVARPALPIPERPAFGDPLDPAARQLADWQEPAREPQALERWRLLFSETAARDTRYDQPKALAWAMGEALAAGGCAFALARLLELGAQTALLGRKSAPLQLRTALATCADADYQAALAVAAAGRGQDWVIDCLISYLFPEQLEWAAQSTERFLAEVDGPAAAKLRAYALENCQFWLAATVLPVPQALRLFRHATWVYPRWLSPYLLQLRVHGPAALPLFLMSADEPRNADRAKEVYALLARLEDRVVLEQLLLRTQDRASLAVLEPLARRWPAATLVVALDLLASGATSVAAKAGLAWAGRFALRHPDALEQASTAHAAGAAFRAMVAALGAAEAGPDELPAVLRQPPWLAKQPAVRVPELQLDPALDADATCWKAGQRQEWRAGATLMLDQRLDPVRTFQLSPDTLQRLQQGQPVAEAELSLPADGVYPELLAQLPAALAAALWCSVPPRGWALWDGGSQLRYLVAQLELAAVPGLVRFCERNPAVALAAALPLRSAALALPAAAVLDAGRKGRNQAAQWLRLHASHVLPVLLAAALGPASPTRGAARTAVQWLAVDGAGAALDEAAQRLGGSALAALQVLLSPAVALALDGPLPRLPRFVTAASLPQLQLRNGKVLPAACGQQFCIMLKLGNLARPYAGVAQVSAACSPESVAGFVWEVFQRWLAAGAPATEAWAFHALGIAGTDQTARQLSAEIRDWPARNANHRAIAALDLLVAIGSDTALLQLDWFARKAKSAFMQEQAAQRIAEIAERRGLTREQLDDRLVPTLGLDAQGRLGLDFGSRQFQVHFDGSLKPVVTGPDGKRLKDLPKPGRNDDPVLAKAAVAAFKGLKQDARTIASRLLQRLESAMCSGRRWSAAEFTSLFVQHPVSRQVALHLLWATYAGPTLVEAFRIAEDGSLADRHDQLWSLPDAAEVGLVHPLDLPAELAGAFGQVFGDYELAPPFAQLGRDTWRLTPAELAQDHLARWDGVRVATGSLLGLAQRGWVQGAAEDGARVCSYSRRLPGSLLATLEFDEGFVVYDPQSTPEQTLRDLRLQAADGDRRSCLWGELPPLAISELVRDLMLMPRRG